MKKETYEKLGAKRFKKLVFKVEKLKWKAIKKLFPNYLNGMEKQYRKYRDKELKKAKTEEERRQIIENYKNSVMLMKKEYYTEQNMNYHIDMNNPDKIKEHLKRNKSIHKMWLKVDAIAAPILISLLALGNTWTIPFIAIVGLEAIKNLQCINLQNYSLTCLEENKELLERKSNRVIERSRNKYREAQDVITKVITESEVVPNIDTIIKESKSKESLEQLRELLLKEKENRERLAKEKGKVKEKVRGYNI